MLNPQRDTGVCKLRFGHRSEVDPDKVFNKNVIFLRFLFKMFFNDTFHVGEKKYFSLVSRFMRGIRWLRTFLHWTYL